MKNNYRSVYAAFDPYPSYKGSAIHIERVTNVLSEKYRPTMLLTLPGHRPINEVPGIDHFQCEYSEDNFLRRGMAFSTWVDDLIESQCDLHIGHFRDIWGGLPILKRKHSWSVFEVNGLPSIELTNRYPNLTPSTLEKIRILEDQCLHEVNLIVCPSQVIAEHLHLRGVDTAKIHVVPNGADTPEIHERPKNLPQMYLAYFGALQPWQGVDVLLKALQYLKDKPELKLIICSSHKAKMSRPYLKLARKLEVEDQVIWKHQLHKEDLHQIIQHALCTVAPLTECSRNLEQGCSPLKIFESMACQTPVIASDIPAIREILTPDTEAKFFRPDRPADLARCIRLLADYPLAGETLAANAYKKFESHYTWKIADQKMSHLYSNVPTLAF